MIECPTGYCCGHLDEWHNCSGCGRTFTYAQILGRFPVTPAIRAVEDDRLDLATREAG